ncbi:Ribonuclease III Rnc [Mycobacteroides abscessus subsp. abscessus]|uniref:ribonuclease III n=1 Tax=Mycobacteroides abscessus TaxID=36809 RepID=UPI0009A65689|nr:ribonuclease III [Mycobacteroides abscessus]SLE82950.1 Ribonuclease III Rnc [Mycobacteroides abscessus subsp. abscessus]SLG42291.1 Ribonuclease III Rnc [Mycobacteroides abscessus subsp. abscessus]
MSRTPEHRHDDLRAAIGVQLGDELLTLALTHRSYAYENGGLPTNERLEFLGDAVLGLTITETLYHSHPDRSEGDLAKLRASIVNTQALAGVARGLTGDGLGAHLLLGKGEENTGGRDKSSILADGMESILGAVYLEHGLETARAVVLTLFGELLETAPKLGAGLDWKTSLQELTAEKGWGAPSYAVTSTGPDHDKEFTATVMVNDTAHGVGVGRSKKEAEQKAAAEAWNSISGDEPLEGRAEGGDEPLEGRAEGGDEPLEGRAEGTVSA